MRSLARLQFEPEVGKKSPNKGKFRGPVAEIDVSKDKLTVL